MIWLVPFADACVRILDPRAASGDVVKLALASHARWATAVSWSPSDAHTLASAAHDGTVKLWDLRSTTPLHTLAAHADKALAVRYHAAGGGDARVCLVSGGADKQMHAHVI